MHKGFLASLTVIASAAGLGYWLWSDTTLTPPSMFRLEQVIRTQPPSTALSPPANERFSAGQHVEQIDLSTVFEPTGEELDLQFLLASIDIVDGQLPMPHEVLETLPQPRPRGGSIQMPSGIRIVSADADDAGSPPTPFDLLRQQLSDALARTAAELLTRMQPLGGTP